jgi:G:T-mismatch repair DNA endonuclease (very short patch repair protein)
MIERICETCGVHFFVKPYRVREGTGRFCSLKCYGVSPSHSLCGKYKRTEEHRKSLAERCRVFFSGKAKTEEHRHRIAQAMTGKKCPALAELNRRRAVTGEIRGTKNPRYGKPLPEKVRDKISRARLAYIARTPIEQRQRSKETKTKISERRKQQWQNPDYVSKLIKAMAVKPNGLELQLIKLLERHFPQFKYNGDFSQGIMLGGLIPDFVNVDGKKQVIEVFGDYWHSPEIIGNDWRRGELGKLMIYNSVGWDCLIIWEHELNEMTEEEIVSRIETFSKVRR